MLIFHARDTQEVISLGTFHKLRVEENSSEETTKLQEVRENKLP